MSPGQLFEIRHRGTRKRDSQVRLRSGKRMAVSVPRMMRNASPSRLAGAAHQRMPRTAGERMRTLDPQRSVDHTEIANLRETARIFERQLGEHTQMGVELRRDVYGIRGTVTDQMKAI